MEVVEVEYIIGIDEGVGGIKGGFRFFGLSILGGDVVIDWEGKDYRRKGLWGKIKVYF